MSVSPQEFQQWREEPFSIIEKACFHISRDNRCRLRPNSKELVGALMAAIGLFGPGGWGLPLEAACRIGVKEVKAMISYEDILRRSQREMA